MTRRVGETVVTFRNERHCVAVGTGGDFRGEARRDKNGCWAVTRPADFDQKPGKVPGRYTPVVVATVAPTVDGGLQKRLVRALLGAM